MQGIHVAQQFIIHTWCSFSLQILGLPGQWGERVLRLLVAPTPMRLLNCLPLRKELMTERKQMFGACKWYWTNYVMHLLKVLVASISYVMGLHGYKKIMFIILVCYFRFLFVQGCHSLCNGVWEAALWWWQSGQISAGKAHFLHKTSVYWWVYITHMYTHYTYTWMHKY